MRKLWKNHRFVVVAIPFVVILAVVVAAAFMQMKSRAEVRSNIDLANRYLSELDYEQAIAYYQKALDIEPKNVEANLGLASVYDATEMYAYAEAIYSSMLEDNDEQAEVYQKLAELYLRQDKREEAKQLLEEAVGKVDDETIVSLYEYTRPAAPAVSMESGAYTERIKVEIIPAEESHTVYYTLDGSEPDMESEVYTSPIIPRNGETTLKVMAVNVMGFESQVVTYNYDIQIMTVEVAVEEPVIDRLIRRELEIPPDEPIHNDDIAQITQLYIVGNQMQATRNEYIVYLEENQYSINGSIHTIYSDEGVITNLNDLRHMPFLEKVAVAYQPQLDISGLSACGAVKELSLVGDHLDTGDLEVLRSMPQLTKLNLGWNEIGDISAVSGLTNLTSLSVWGNQLTSIGPAANLSELAYFDFSDNQVTDIQALAGLTKLQELWMYRNQVTDISAVSALGELKVLMVRDNPLGNPEAVRSIYPHLTRIDTDVLNLGDRAE